MDDGSGSEGDDLEYKMAAFERHQLYLKQWRHINRPPPEATGEKVWWMTLKDVSIRNSCSNHAAVVGSLKQGSPVFCQALAGAWLRIDTTMEPEQPPKSPELGTPVFPSFKSFPKSTEAWVKWDEHEEGHGVLMRPLNHLDKLVQYRNSNVKLPRDAVTWTLSEIDVFLGSLGFIKPSRESSMMRCSKRLIRAVRGGALGLEYRVDEQGAGGVYANETVAKGRHVEVCPLLEVDASLRMKSDMLKRITTAMNGSGNKRFAIILGLGKLYTKSRKPNLRWSYRGEDEIILWAAEEVHSGAELTVDFSAPARPLDEAGRPPVDWQPPPSKTGKFRHTGYIGPGNSIIHGRGVFAMKDIPAGELLESCPAIRLDEAGAEAMFSYRWGVKGDSDPNYYLPLGCGSLYNHSENNTARGCLDVKRRVLEFHTTAEIKQGQEIFVSYGDSYFDEDFAGHRKSELLRVEAPQADGDDQLQMMVELQRALLKSFTSEDFSKELRKRTALPEGAKEKTRAIERLRSVHSLIIETEIPVLERFGFSKSWQGSKDMTNKLALEFQRVRDQRSAAVIEGFHNNAYLDHFVRRFEPPPAEYWETRLLELVMLGTEDSDEPETLILEVPVQMPAGFTLAILSQVVQPGVPPRLIRKRNGRVHDLYKDHEMLPNEPILAAGFGDTWPYKEYLEHPEQGPWEAIWKWLKEPENQRRCSGFESRTFKIAGTWDDFRCNEMKWDGQCFVYMVTLGKNKWESFQILVDGSWNTTLYPSIKDGSPYKEHKLMGPDKRGHGRNWTIGFAQEDKGEPGCRYLIELSLDERGQPGRVHWRTLRRPTEAEKAETELLQRVKEAAEQRKILRESEQVQLRCECERLEKERQERKASARSGWCY